MAALIAWLCRVDHSDPDCSDHLPKLTLHHGDWAYCSHGGSRDHQWNAIEPSPIEMLRVRHYASEGSATQEVRPK